ncbi:hypothetical protein AVEN_274770-1 [Araneus ventricosus]|uniref:Uncharacterized protein n=1 Tax=Araneus ventricosus TaxID=182803 RepID=A0A4Y2N4V5_ARAVE|nr:hypothetical protein AVEN_274770-1 [Araneus ventricosus]
MLNPSTSWSYLPPHWCGSFERGYRIRCRLRHLNMVQNDQVRPKIALPEIVCPCTMRIAACSFRTPSQSTQSQYSPAFGISRVFYRISRIIWTPRNPNRGQPQLVRIPGVLLCNEEQKFAAPIVPFALGVPL